MSAPIPPHRHPEQGLHLSKTQSAVLRAWADVTVQVHTGARYTRQWWGYRVTGHNEGAPGVRACRGSARMGGYRGDRARLPVTVNDDEVSTQVIDLARRMLGERHAEPMPDPLMGAEDGVARYAGFAGEALTS